LGEAIGREPGRHVGASFASHGAGAPGVVEEREQGARQRVGAVRRDDETGLPPPQGLPGAADVGRARGDAPRQRAPQGRGGGAAEGRASLRTGGEGSQSTEASTATSSAAVIAGTSSRNPRNRQALSIPSTPARRRSAGSPVPLPTRTKRASGRRFRTSAAARR